MLLELRGQRTRTRNVNLDRRLSQALRVGKPNRDDIGDIRGRAFGAGCASQLRMCWARLSSVRERTHPCGSAVAAAGNEGCAAGAAFDGRQGVLHAHVRGVCNAGGTGSLGHLA